MACLSDFTEGWTVKPGNGLQGKASRTIAPNSVGSLSRIAANSGQRKKVVWIARMLEMGVSTDFLKLRTSSVPFRTRTILSESASLQQIKRAPETSTKISVGKSSFVGTLQTESCNDEKISGQVANSHTRGTTIQIPGVLGADSRYSIVFSGHHRDSMPLLSEPATVDGSLAYG